jgi:hypothetical protein
VRILLCKPHFYKPHFCKPHFCKHRFRNHRFCNHQCAGSFLFGLRRADYKTSRILALAKTKQDANAAPALRKQQTQIIRGFKKSASKRVARGNIKTLPDPGISSPSAVQPWEIAVELASQVETRLIYPKTADMDHQNFSTNPKV